MKNVKIFADFICPFSYIGFSIIDKLKKDYPHLEIEWMPFELDPEASLEGKKVTESLTPEQLETGYKRVENLALEYNLIYNNKTTSFNSHKLHKASLYAASVGKFYEFSKEAFRTVFEYGENIAKDSILNKIGASVGIDTKEMHKQISEGKFDHIMEKSKKLISLHKVNSVPTFLINDKNKITTLKEYNKIVKDILEK